MRIEEFKLKVRKNETSDNGRIKQFSQARAAGKRLIHSCFSGQCLFETSRTKRSKLNQRTNHANFMTQRLHSHQDSDSDSDEQKHDNR